MSGDLTLRDPERCPMCGADSAVIDSRKRPTYRIRRRRCYECRRVWPTYESVLDPGKIKVRGVPTH